MSSTNFYGMNLKGGFPFSNAQESCHSVTTKQIVKGEVNE